MAYIPNYIPSPEFALQRSYLWGVAVGWWDMTIIQVGQHTILKEIPFGGYELHILFRDNFWTWNSSAWRLDIVIDDIYAKDPGGTVVNAGNIDIFTAWSPTPNIPELRITCQPNGGVYAHQVFPSAPPDWYATYWLDNPTSPFIAS